MSKISRILVIATLISVASAAFAKDNIGVDRKPNPKGGVIAAGCKASTDKVNLDLNNVRCPILMNGDMWWDAINNISRYEIPKGSGKTSLFAGAIWIGGKDIGGNLKVAAQTYRQSGSDFWPGPLDTTTITTNQNECLAYDRHWKLLRSDVQTFVNQATGTSNIPNYVIPPDILSWPGNGDASKNEGHFLAPFNESIKLGNPENAIYSGIYRPDLGDYPDFDLSKTPKCGGGRLFGDQNIWWVFNDEGNIHTETGGAPFGLEIRAQAFCFQTNDEVNNMTFYNYQIINRGHSTDSAVWFGAWVDPDLGYANDDYVGCDVKRGLGYVYNGEAFDPGTYGYGANPPACGLDFFEGPVADANDGLDNNRDGTIDEPGEKIIMSQFVYYNNDFTVTGNPRTATDYYNYLKGIWIDGTPITFGGTGHGGSTPTSFMFPGTTDPTNWGTGLGHNNGPTPPSGNWTESTAGDLPGDRRFIQSAGKFTLQPGAVNNITTGAVWARTTSGGPLASVQLMQIADDKAQALFDACFAITNGPDAPDVTIRELDKELIISITPDKFGNDSMETNYNEEDFFTNPHTPYLFQGYQIYQLKDNSVSTSDLLNPDKARLVGQSDIKDSVSQIVNQLLQGDLNAYMPVEEVNGENKGIKHTYDIKTDAFASGTSQLLVNHQTYYYTVIAYAYNALEVNFDPYVPVNGHSIPYLAGRRNVFTYTAIPHIPDPQSGGLQLNSEYGQGPQVTRLQGQGNGGLVLDMTQSSIIEALSSANNYRVDNPVYESGRGPIDVEIYDPVKVGNHDFIVYFKDTTGNFSNNGIAQINKTNGDTVIDNIIGVNVSGSGDTSKILICDTTASGAYFLSSTGSAASYTFSFSQPVNWVQINAIFANGLNNGEIDFEKDGSSYAISSANLNGPFGNCSQGDTAVILNGKLTNDGQQGNNPSNIVTIQGPLVEIKVSSPGGDAANFGLRIPYGNSKWYIKQLPDGPIDSSDQTIKGGNEKIFSQWGIKINAQQVRMAGQQGNDNNGFLEGTMEFADSTNGKWLSGISDVDRSPQNWILSGTDTCLASCKLLPPGDYTEEEDPTQVYEKVINGTWAPYRLASDAANGPVFNYAAHTNASKLDALASVDIVITSDKSLWSRSVVIEEDSFVNLTEGGAIKGDPRNHPSVDKNGRKSGDQGYNSAEGDLVSTTGMGWFPGYAINVETGERLNIMFGEDSYLEADNGRDMLFNPSPNTYSQYGDPLFGGKHYIYIMGHSLFDDGLSVTTAYDACNMLYHRIVDANEDPLNKALAWKDCMWVGLPLLASGHKMLESDVKIRLRVAKSYRDYDVGGNTYNPLDFAHEGIPYYKFSTSGMEAKSDQTNVAKTALDIINVVPNPYYAHSTYEKNQLDNRIKIVNLPNKCTVSIYTTTGTLVRQFKRDVPSSTDLTAGVQLQSINNSSISSETSIDWDLKNSFGVPVGGGVYIIHVKADFGEKVIKWFGVMRPIDLDTF